MLKRRGHVEDLGVDGKITGLTVVNVTQNRAHCWLFRTRHRVLRVHKLGGNI
jgi:hypothetical protein